MQAVKWAEGLEKLLVPIDSIKQHPDNPNNGDVETVIESIQLNGFNQVITVDRNSGYILAGHTRWAALHALGADQCPVVWVEKDEAGRARYLVGDNATGRKARMDELEEAKLLNMLRQTDEGLAGSGFTENEYADLLEKIAKLNEQEIDTSGSGFGEAGVQGIYEVTVQFEDDNQRNNLFDELKLRFPNKVRWLNY